MFRWFPSLFDRCDSKFGDMKAGLTFGEENLGSPKGRNTKGRGPGPYLTASSEAE